MSDRESEALDRLFGAPLGEFVAVRDALARERAAAGDREAASRLKAARKPTVPAWALNRLARERRTEVERLFEFDAALGRAHASGDREGFRTASDARRDALARLLDLAGGILREAGHPDSATNRERMAETLHAAAADPEVREQLRLGRLVREAQPGGFAGGLLLDAAAAENRGAGKLRVAERLRREAEELGERAAELEARAVALDEQAGALEERARRLVEQAERSRAGAASARDRAARVREEAAERAADAARSREGG